MNKHCITSLSKSKGLFTPLALALLLVCTLAQAQPRPDSAKADTTHEYIGKRNPWVAFGLSCLLPGSGQLYNHEKTKGAIMMGVFLPSVAYLVWFRGRIENDPTQNPAQTYSLDKVSGPELMLGIVAGMTYSGAYVWSIFDAPLSAKRINRKNGYTARDRPGVGLVFVPDPRDSRHVKPGLGLRAGF